MRTVVTTMLRRAVVTAGFAAGAAALLVWIVPVPLGLEAATVLWSCAIGVWFALQGGGPLLGGFITGGLGGILLILAFRPAPLAALVLFGLCFGVLARRRTGDLVERTLVFLTTAGGAVIAAHLAGSWLPVGDSRGIVAAGVSGLIWGGLLSLGFAGSRPQAP